jgi:hypothetical protein
MTNKPAPTQANQYVSHILTPLSSFIAGPAAALLSDSVKQRFTFAITDIVVEEVTHKIYYHSTMSLNTIFIVCQSSRICSTLCTNKQQIPQQTCQRKIKQQQR